MAAMRCTGAPVLVVDGGTGVMAAALALLHRQGFAVAERYYDARMAVRLGGGEVPDMTDAQMRGHRRERRRGTPQSEQCIAPVT